MRIVVDASVAHAAGVGQPPASACLEALTSIDAGGCTVVRSAMLVEEWQGHASRYARLWLSNMVARKRTVLSDGVWPRYSALLDAAAHELEGGHPRAVAKDVDVVATAFATDRRVVSLDQVQRRLLARLLPHVHDLHQLYWVDPTEPPTNPWLRECAPERIELTLGGRMQ